MAKRTCANSVMWTRLFPLPGWFGFTTSEAAFSRVCRKHGTEQEFCEDGAFAVATLFESMTGGDPIYIVTCDQGKLAEAHADAAQVAALLAHEASHVVDQIGKILRDRLPPGELVAQSIQGLVQVMLGCLHEAEGEGA